MVRVQEHEQRMMEIKKQAEASQGRKQKELMKCYHRMQKQLNQCNIYIAEREKANGENNRNTNA